MKSRMFNKSCQIFVSFPFFHALIKLVKMFPEIDIIKMLAHKGTGLEEIPQ